MTVEKAIEEVRFNMSHIGLGARAARRVKEAKEMAIEALEKMQKLEENKTYFLYRSYLSIGTVDELRALKEKQIAKKPIVQGLGQRYCPVCKCGGADHQYCARCGQKLDWSEV